MRYLFVHQNFPGQFLHLLRHLVRAGGNELVFIAEANNNAIPGVRKVSYRVAASNPATHPDAQDLETAVARAAAVAGVAGNLKALGFRPDIIIGHHGWGELLNLQDVFPGVPLLGYYEFFYSTAGLDVGFDPEFPAPLAGAPRVRAKNAVNLLALNAPGHGQTPTLFQHATYPDWAQPKISVVQEGVDLQTCRPDPGARTRPYGLGGFAVHPGEKLVTFVARDLEPYRGFHIMMRALPRLLRMRPDLKVVLVGGSGVSYGAPAPAGTWREHMLNEVGRLLDPARVCFAGRVDYRAFIGLLQRSDAHVYLTYPFVASWSLREALACGCAVVGSDTAPVHEFVADGQTGLLTPFLDPAALARRVQEVLEDDALAARLRGAAREWAVAHLGLEEYLHRYLGLIARVAGQG